MKRIIYLFVIIIITTAQSQTIMRIWKGGVKIDSVAVTSDLKITFSTGSGGFTCGVSTVLYEGKTYNTVSIGSQCWLRENLNVGTMIPGGLDQGNNGVIEKYCYDNNLLNCDTYGGLYQWHEAMQYVTTSGARGICPEGWHIPTYAELQTLKSAVGNDGNALKAVGQGSGNGAGTNTSGFSALLAGFRGDYDSFYNLSITANFWSSTEYNATYVHYLNLFNNDSGIIFSTSKKDHGISLRCVLD